MVVSDGKASHDEKATIQHILKKVNSPHSAQDVNSSIESFIKQVKERGFSPVLKAVLEATRKFKKRGKQKILLKAFALVAKSDGSVDEAERKVIARFKAVLQESLPENSDNRPDFSDPIVSKNSACCLPGHLELFDVNS